MRINPLESTDPERDDPTPDASFARFRGAGGPGRGRPSGVRGVDLSRSVLAAAWRSSCNVAGFAVGEFRGVASVSAEAKGLRERGEEFDDEEREELVVAVLRCCMGIGVEALLIRVVD